MKFTNKRRKLIYLGWLGFNNFGDDLLHATWQLALNSDLTVEAPLTRRDYAKAAKQYFRDRLALVGSERLVLLGGGTTVGFDSWAGHLGRAMKYYGASGAIIPGAGAAEHTDSYALGFQASGWNAWNSLKKVALLGVRGPLTSAECSREWKPAPVIGDPALLYPVLAGMVPGVDNTAGVIGACVGSDPSTRFDLDTVATAISRVADKAGQHVRVFQLSTADKDATHALMQRLGSRASMHVYNGNVRTTMEEIQRCSVFISERLHGAVAAVSLDIPTVPLAYASKSDDFWMSITGNRAPITIDMTADTLVAAIADAQNPSTRATIATTVAHLQSSLFSTAGLILSWLDGTKTRKELLSTGNTTTNPATGSNKATQEAAS